VEDNASIDPGAEGAALDVTFKGVRDPAFTACLPSLKAALPAGNRLVVWGRGHTTAADRKDWTDPVVMTFDSVTSCERQVIPPVQPVIAQYSFMAQAMNAPYDANPETPAFIPLTGDEYSYVESALMEDGQLSASGHEFLDTMFSDITLRIKLIIHDEKMSPNEKVAALRALARTGLSAKDYHYLAMIGHKEGFLHRLTSVQQAQLRFLVNDKVVPNIKRKDKIDRFIQVVNPMGPAQSSVAEQEASRAIASVVIPTGLCAALGIMVYMMHRSATASKHTPRWRRLVSWALVGIGFALAAYALSKFAQGRMNKDEYVLAIPIPIFLTLGSFMRIPHHQKRHWVSLASLGGAFAGMSLAYVGFAPHVAPALGTAAGILFMSSVTVSFFAMVAPPYLQQGKNDIVSRILCFLTTLVFAWMIFLSAVLSVVSKI
jgi:hypothetical protein